MKKPSRAMQYTPPTTATAIRMSIAPDGSLSTPLEINPMTNIISENRSRDYCFLAGRADVSPRNEYRGSDIRRRFEVTPLKLPREIGAPEAAGGQECPPHRGRHKVPPLRSQSLASVGMTGWWRSRLTSGRRGSGSLVGAGGAGSCGPCCLERCCRGFPGWVK